MLGHALSALSIISWVLRPQNSLLDLVAALRQHLMAWDAQTVKWARAQDYNWTGISGHTTLSGKAKRSLLQFTPYSWDNFEWRAFSTPLRCLQASGLLIVFLVMEVCDILF